MKPDPDLSARTAALHLLSAKSYTADELRRKLKHKGFESEEIQSVLDDFNSKGYLNDRDYAARYTEMKRKHAYFGKRMIAAQLKNKGVSSEIITETVENNHTDHDEYQIAKDAARKKLTQWHLADNKDLDRLRMRIYGFLQRRGFSNQIIYRVIHEYLPDSDSDGEYFDSD